MQHKGVKAISKAGRGKVGRSVTGHAVLNSESGTLKSIDAREFGERMVSAFKEHGHTLSVEIQSGKDIVAALKKAAADKSAGLLIAAGGDGTISLAASLAHDKKKTLGVIPAGTMNLFGRALKMPLDLDEAVQALAAGAPGDVDIASVNGRMFIHQFSVGLHPRMIRLREKYHFQTRLGKMLVSLKTLFEALQRPPLFKARITIDGHSVESQFSSIAISNNLYGDSNLPFAAKLDGGELGVYLIGNISRQSNVRLFIDLLLGAWRTNKNVQELSARKVVIDFLEIRRDAKAVVDGELLPLEKKVSVKIHPGALRVIIPST